MSTQQIMWMLHRKKPSIMNTNETPPCSTHPNAPHGFDRDGSHAADRYVCDCEGWVAPDGAPSDAPTPESHRAYLASIDDTGCVTRMEPIWDTMHRLERERDEARAEAARLRELIGLASTSFSMLEAYLGPQWFEAVSNMELVGPDKIHSAALAKEGQR